jgi:hypothetical protein
MRNAGRCISAELRQSKMKRTMNPTMLSIAVVT